MRRAGVPTAKSASFVGMGPALEYIGNHPEPLVVKASGLAAGKGAVVCQSRIDAAKGVRAMLDGALGEAGEKGGGGGVPRGGGAGGPPLADGGGGLTLPPAPGAKRRAERRTRAGTAGT